MQPKLDAATPPICPACHRQVFRAGHMATFHDALAKRQRCFTVCMGCSTIWELTGTVEALNFRQVQLADAEPILVDVARTFARHRAMADAIGVPHERFAERLHELAQAIRAKWPRPPMS